MCQSESLRKMFAVWSLNPAGGVRQLDVRLTSFSLRSLMKDSDCDGLPDFLEARLLEKFRPYFKFSTFAGNDDDHRPADAKWYITNCEIVLDVSGGTHIVTNDVLAVHPEKILQFLVQPPDTDFAPSDILLNPRRTKTHLSVPEELRKVVWAGASWDEVKKKGNVGFYGHVVPVYLPDNLEKQLFKIEYWLFCPYNDANNGGALDHESDWMTVQVIYDPGTAHIPSDKIPAEFFEDNDAVFPSENIYSVIHWAHGAKTEFLVQNATSVFGHTTDSGTKFQGLQSDNLKVMFLKDPEGGAWSHPVVYIQHGNHEFYPTGEVDHNGGSFSFLTSTPPNIGEIEHPVTLETDAAVLILRFNGFWGLYNSTNSPPPGPALHYAWSWLPTIDDPTDPNYRDNRTRLEIARMQVLTGNQYFE
ncbi:MAG: hypothetical protein ABI707_05325 [Ferruginibacter sp.]